MSKHLKFTKSAKAQLKALKSDPAKASAHKAVSKALRLLMEDPRHPGLNTHKFKNESGPRGEPIFEAYAQNKTPGAFRIFFFHGPGVDELTITAIIKHP